MRKFGRLLLLIIMVQVIAFFANPVSAQKLKPADVPADVTQTLEYQYPYVKVTGWAKDNGNYVASIKDEGANGKVYISESGQWLYTHFNVPQNELPSTIMEYVRTNYPDFIVSVSCLQEKENEKAQYYLEVKPDGVGMKPSVLLFSTTGRNELVSRVDPDNFKDPTLPEEKPAPKAPTPKADKPVASKTDPKADKPAAPKQEPKADKPAAPKQEPKEDKPVAQKTEPKPAKEAKPVKESEPKEPKEPKPEKPKKEKPEEVITDEHGNVALKPNTVPDLVTKALAKKVMHPEELNWFLIDSTYVAKCVYSGKKTAVYIKPNGLWDKTLTVLPEESVTGPMLKHLNDFYKGYRFKTAVREQRADKQDKTMVDFYEKANYKAKLVTTVIFDKTGKLIRTIDPDYQLGGEDSKQANADDDALDKYYEKMNMSLDNDDSKDVPENVKAAFKLKYPRVTNVEWKEDDNMNYQAIYFSARGKEICVFNSYGEIVETMVMGKVENLSSTIDEYIKKNYKNCKVTEFYTVRKMAEKLTCYKVFITNKKTNEEDILWFNASGRPLEN